MAGKSLRNALCVIVMVAWAAPAAAGENWPEFRGATGMGLSRARSVPVEWSSAENVAWKTEIAGSGWSSPVCVAGRVYLTTAVEIADSADGDRSLRALCLDADSGAIVWNVEVFKQDGSQAPNIHGKNSHASPTPLVALDRLFVHFGHQGTACLDLSGHVLWRKTIAYQPVHGNGGSPILAGRNLIFSCDGGGQQWVLALDRESGEQRWRADRNTDASKKFSFSTPLLIALNGQKQVISPGSDAVCAYDPATGSEIWRVRYDGYSVIPRPVFAHGLVFLSTGYDSPSVMAIRADGQGDVTDTHVAWTLSKGAPHAPSLLVAGDELFMVSDRGVASCLDARSGALHWQERLGGNYSASPVWAEGRVYFQSEEGIGTVIAAETTFRRLAANRMEARTLASYAVTDGAIFLRTDKHLYRIGTR